MYMGNRMIDTTTIGGRIRELRICKGLTQEELGFRIGVNNKSVISEYENDRREVSLPILKELVEELDTSLTYLVHGTEDEIGDDPNILKAIRLLKKIKTKKGKKVVLEHIKLISMMEE